MVMRIGGGVHGGWLPPEPAHAPSGGLCLRIWRGEWGEKVVPMVCEEGGT